MFSESSIERSNSFCNDSLHLYIILIDGINEGLSSCIGEFSESISLGGSEINSLLVLLSHGIVERFLGCSNSGFDSSLFSIEESEEVVSVVRILLPLGIDVLIMSFLTPVC